MDEAGACTVKMKAETHGPVWIILTFEFFIRRMLDLDTPVLPQCSKLDSPNLRIWRDYVSVRLTTMAFAHIITPLKRYSSVLLRLGSKLVESGDQAENDLGERIIFGVSLIDKLAKRGAPVTYIPLRNGGCDEYGHDPVGSPITSHENSERVTAILEQELGGNAVMLRCTCQRGSVWVLKVYNYDVPKWFLGHQEISEVTSHDYSNIGELPHEHFEASKLSDSTGGEIWPVSIYTSQLLYNANTTSESLATATREADRCDYGGTEGKGDTSSTWAAKFLSLNNSAKWFAMPPLKHRRICELGAGSSALPTKALHMAARLNNLQASIVATDYSLPALKALSHSVPGAILVNDLPASADRLCLAELDWLAAMADDDALRQSDIMDSVDQAKGGLPTTENAQTVMQLRRNALQRLQIILPNKHERHRYAHLAHQFDMIIAVDVTYDSWQTLVIPSVCEYLLSFDQDAVVLIAVGDWHRNEGQYISTNLLVEEMRTRGLQLLHHETSGSNVKAQGQSAANVDVLSNFAELFDAEGSKMESIFLDEFLVFSRAPELWRRCV